MLGFDTLEESLASEPREMVSVSPEQWKTLQALHAGGGLRQEFHAAWINGRAFLHAEDALRMRRPATIEWKGATRAPGDEVVPADLRVDHVYLVSCKYLSKIILNTSPAHVFDRLLMGGHGQRGQDWYRSIAPEALDELFEAATGDLDVSPPARLEQLSNDDQKVLARQLKGRWPLALRPQATQFASTVATRSAERWRSSLASSGAEERFLWRLLRIGSAPYFVLGADRDSSLRLRIETPWDWKQRYRLVRFTLEPVESEQPTIKWVAEVEDLRSRMVSDLRGHVEIRWSHGKFNGPPEAKVYLDTPHHRVPGYVPLA
jgi:hypothetical protein